ncbi:hypothetical protein HMPREF0262_03427 [Clostridium sp. ATCC 29733]|nr:hypothetical protein HMPREF0262_03427 [Clostridium sp. ATCC 29733]
MCRSAIYIKPLLSSFSPILPLFLPPEKGQTKRGPGFLRPSPLFCHTVAPRRR